MVEEISTESLMLLSLICVHDNVTERKNEILLISEQNIEKIKITDILN
jgi:hypothetical protein